MLHVLLRGTVAPLLLVDTFGATDRESRYMHRVGALVLLFVPTGATLSPVTVRHTIPTGVG